MPCNDNSGLDIAVSQCSSDGGIITLNDITNSQPSSHLHTHTGYTGLLESFTSRIKESLVRADLSPTFECQMGFIDSRPEGGQSAQ